MSDAASESVGFLNLLGHIGRFAAESVSHAVAVHVAATAMRRTFDWFRGAGFDGDERYLRGSILPLLGCTGDLRFHFGGEHYLVEGIHSDNSSTGQVIAR